MTKPKAIGIDLGTTNSAVAWVDDTGQTQMVPNAEGDLLTPSVVLFDDSEVIVGREARNATVLNPDRVAVWVKRDMGAPVYNRPIRGEYLPPEVIQACILRKLRTDVVHVLGPESRVVITVPAYFDEPRRKATADAGEMAGLTVLDIVNEPTAGALAFGERLGYLSRSSAPQREITVMVYDLGGGTFDVTLLKLAPGNIQTIATDGDVQLGGYDWDLRIVEYAAEAFKKLNGVDPRENPSATGRLFNAAVDAKHALSARAQTLIPVDYAGRSLEVPLTRQQFEQMTADLLERTAYTTRQLLTAAKMQWKNVNRVLLVGGSTRMPAVPAMLQQLTGLLPDHTVNPDEAVARGAALYANYLLGKRAGGKEQPSFEVTNVNSHSLGVEGIDQETLRKKNVIIVPRNTPLPVKVTERFATKTDGQRSIVIQVLEGESSLPGECTAIGRTVIRDLPPTLPKNWPVEVTFEYGANGRLTVRGVVPGTHREVVLDMERAVGLSHDGVARWKKAVGAEGGFDAFETILMEVLETGKSSQPLPPVPAGPKPAAALGGLPDAAGPMPPPGIRAVPPAAAKPVPSSPQPKRPAAPLPPAAKPLAAPPFGSPPATAPPPVGPKSSSAPAGPKAAPVPSPVAKAAAATPKAAPVSPGPKQPAPFPPLGPSPDLSPKAAPSAPLGGFGAPLANPQAPVFAPLPQAGPIPPAGSIPPVSMPPPAGAMPPLGSAPSLGSLPPVGSFPSVGPLPPVGSFPPVGPLPLSMQGPGAFQPPGAVPQFVPPLAAATTRLARRSGTRRVLGLVFYLTSAIGGLSVGYLLLAWLKPDTFPLPFRLPW